MRLGVGFGDGDAELFFADDFTSANCAGDGGTGEDPGWDSQSSVNESSQACDMVKTDKGVFKTGGEWGSSRHRKRIQKVYAGSRPMGEALEARALLPNGMAQEEEEAIQSRRTQKMQNNEVSKR